jgi:serine O-acetyltransferase
MNIVFFHKIAHWCLRKKIPLIPAIIKIIIFLLFNSVIPASVRLGKGTRFMYGGIGCVIHKRAVIGERVCLGQGITIGRKLKPSCPVIGNDVYIAAGSRVLGDIIIGNNVIIGANSVVINDVPDNCVVAGSPAKVVKWLDCSIYELLGDVL